MPDDSKREGAPHTVLVIDDEPSTAETLTKLLQFYGYAVASAPSKEAGWIIGEGLKWNIKAVLLDVRMPEAESAAEFAGRVKAVNSSIKVIFMSGFSSRALNRIGEKPEKADGVLQKPFDAGALLKLLAGE